MICDKITEKEEDTMKNLKGILFGAAIALMVGSGLTANWGTLTGRAAQDTAYEYEEETEWEAENLPEEEYTVTEEAAYASESTEETAGSDGGGAVPYVSAGGGSYDPYEESFAQTPEASEPVGGYEDSECEVVVTEYGAKYHYDSCYHLYRSENLSYYTVQEAQNMGYEPCKDCCPPV